MIRSGCLIIVLNADYKVIRICLWELKLKLMKSLGKSCVKYFFIILIYKTNYSFHSWYCEHWWESENILIPTIFRDEILFKITTKQAIKVSFDKFNL